MKMINEIAIVTVTAYSGTTTPNKNGKMPVMLQCIAGTIPNRNVLDGTVAERAGFEIGKTYMTNVRTAGQDAVFGEDFNWVKVSELSGVEILKAKNELGDPVILNIERPAGYDDSYQRKGDVVESNRTVREREGKYEKALSSQSSHKTARNVVEGSSVGSGGKILKDQKLEEESTGKAGPLKV